MYEQRVDKYGEICYKIFKDSVAKCLFVRNLVQIAKAIFYTKTRSTCKLFIKQNQVNYALYMHK